MKTKTNAEMLTSLKQYNKVAREGKAKKEGFASAASFIQFLDAQIKLGFADSVYLPPSSTPVEKKKSPVKTKVIGERHTIHVIDVLDSSGSMSGGKIKAAIQGVNAGIIQLKSDKEPVDYTYTLCDFSDDIIFRYETENIKDVDTFRGQTRGSTSLYDAIGDSVAKVSLVKKDADKVLVNIYTDGQENSSRRYNAKTIASMIEDLSKVGWTFTFIGTAGDVKYAQSNLKFHDSNTLVHDNTERGMAHAFAVNSASRSAYSSKVSAGEDVSTGFYKDIK